jgi:hypothetical protein
MLGAFTHITAVNLTSSNSDLMKLKMPEKAKIIFTHHYEIITGGVDFEKFVGIETTGCSQLTKLVLVKQPSNLKSSAYYVLGNLDFTFNNKNTSVLALLERLSMGDIRDAIGKINSLISQEFIKYLPTKAAL